MNSNHKAWVNKTGEKIARRIFADESIYTIEQERIFNRHWLYLAHRSQFKESGDFILTYMGEVPVIVALDETGKIVVTINSCSHRGLPVCRFDHGNSKRFICPYHNWAYAVDGTLVAVPQERKMKNPIDKSGLGLKRVPKVEQYQGLIFASLNEQAPSLDDYLGDMKFHLDVYFDRFEGGVEVVGAAHKWRVRANWKMPVENQMGDVGHGPFLHSSLLSGPEIVNELETLGYNSTFDGGHGASCRLFPADADPLHIAWGAENTGMRSEDKEFLDYITAMQLAATKRLGVGGRVKGLTCGIYPNFNFLWSNSAIRVSHPRAAGEVEYWTWWVVPSLAPDRIKTLLRANYNALFGPAGMIEQEDCEAWTQQFVGSNINVLKDEYFYYGLGLGEESHHKELPGLLGNCYNEVYARGFYKQWQVDMNTSAQPLNLRAAGT